MTCADDTGARASRRARSSQSRSSRLLALAAAMVVAALAGACATASPPAAWESRLRGEAVVLLGEVHDNAVQHRLRLEVLRRALAAGWRPAIAMEQFDRERQAEIDRARRERPGDAQHVIDLAAPSGAGNGWDWALYRPFVALALEHGLPLVAANLSNGDTARIVRGDYGAVFDRDAVAELGLDRPVPANLQSAQEAEIDAGHCHVLPAEAWPRMARSQLARDAVMARVLAEHGAGGVVLLAGNGHVRKDIGVPRWLRVDPGRVVSVGYLEEGNATPPVAFDAVVRTPAAARADPCAAFIERRRR